jgi:Tfp pilus assembly protein PilN
MNFLRHQGAGLTYKRIVTLLVVWLLFLSFIGGIQQVRLIYAKYALKRDKLSMMSLDKEKEKRIAIAQMAGVAKDDRMKQKDLYMLFMTPPKWSGVLTAISRSAPRQLRLTELTSSGAQPDQANMKIKGTATSVRVVTDFIMRLESSEYFKRVELVKTEWNATQRSFEFEVAANVIPTGRS